MINDKMITAIVDKAMQDAMNSYMDELAEWDDPEDTGLEETFQDDLVRHLDRKLSNTPAPGVFRIRTQLTYPLCSGRKDKVDIVIKYFETNKDTNQRDEIRYFIELKFKHPGNGDPDYAQIHAFTDITELEEMVDIGRCVKAYFIFLTDEPKYLKTPKSGTRTQIPMHQGARIEPNKVYNATGKSAHDRQISDQHESGYMFRHGYDIDWEAVVMPSGHAYFYILININK